MIGRVVFIFESRDGVDETDVALLLLGVTPFASILKHIWYRQKRGKLGSLRRVEFFWVCRDAPSFGWFQSLLQEVEAAQADRKSPPPDPSFCAHDQ